MKPKYQEKKKLRYVNTNSFIVYIKAEDIYVVIAKDVEARFDISNCELETPPPKGKKVIGLMKDELGGKIMTQFASLRPKHICI